MVKLKAKSQTKATRKPKPKNRFKPGKWDERKSKIKDASKSLKKYKRWDNRMYVDIYDLVRSGIPESRAIEVLGFKRDALMKWKRKDPVLVYVLDKAKAPQSNQTEDFRDFVYGRLPENLQELWDELSKIDDAPSALARVEAMLEMGGKKTRQHLFLHALMKSNFMITKACRAVNIQLKEFRNWIEKDEEFAELVDQIRIWKKDFVEGKLFDLVEAGETPAVIFANKALNKDRGYGDSLKVEHQGQVEHKHTLVNIDELRLPLEVRVAILDAIEKQEQLKIEGPVGEDENILEAEFVNKNEQSPDPLPVTNKPKKGKKDV